MNSFYALEDIKKKAIKYYLKIDEMKATMGADEPNSSNLDNSEDPFDE